MNDIMEFEKVIIVSFCRVIVIEQLFKFFNSTSHSLPLSFLIGITLSTNNVKVFLPRLHIQQHAHKQRLIYQKIHLCSTLLDLIFQILLICPFPHLFYRERILESFFMKVQRMRLTCDISFQRLGLECMCRNSYGV